MVYGEWVPGCGGLAGGYVWGNWARGNRRAAGEESPVNQRVSGIWTGYVGVLLWLLGVKYVSGYRGGVRKMNILAKG